MFMRKEKEKPVEKPIMSKIAFHADGSVVHNDKRVGFRTKIEGKKVFVCERNDVDFNKKQTGFMVLPAIFELIDSLGHEEIIIRYQGQDGKVDLFVSPIKDFIKHAKEIKFGETYLFLELKHWKKV